MKNVTEVFTSAGSRSSFFFNQKLIMKFTWVQPYYQVDLSCAVWDLFSYLIELSFFCISDYRETPTLCQETTLTVKVPYTPRLIHHRYQKKKGGIIERPLLPCF